MGRLWEGSGHADRRRVKTNDLAMAAGRSVDPARWQEAFEALTSRIAGRFARVEPRRRVWTGVFRDGAARPPASMLVAVSALFGPDFR
jgi:hypothetical protein